MTTLSRPWSRRGVAVAALALVAGTVAPAAWADDDTIQPYSSSQCAANRMCLWSGAAYTANFWSVPTSTPANVSGMSTARSLWNRTPNAVRIYTETGGTGSWTCVSSGEQDADVWVTARSVRTLVSSTC